MTEQLDRLTRLRELEATLRPVVNAIQSNTAMGTSGLVTAYMKLLEQIEAIESAQAKREETPFDQIAAKRAAKASTGTARTSKRRI